MVAASGELTLEVVTPMGTVVKTITSSVQAPSASGEFGVLPGHRPLLAALRCGVLKYQDGNRLELAAIGPGFVEVEPEKVLVLTDRFTPRSGVDVTETQRKLAEAEQALLHHEEIHEGTTYLELQLEIDWYKAQLDSLAD
ncbi:MAG: ATP synthase F1 subunit epsilon [Myxococcota bacterium]